MRAYCPYCGRCVGRGNVGYGGHWIGPAVFDLIHGYGVCAVKRFLARKPTGERWEQEDRRRPERTGYPPEGYRFPEPGEYAADAGVTAMLYWPAAGPGELWAYVNEEEELP